MASLDIEGDRLKLRFSTIEKIGALRSGAEVALEDIASVEVSPSPWREAKGLRVGTGFPRAMLLGTMIRPGRNDIAAIYGKGPIVVVSLREGAPYERLLVTVPDPEGVASRLRDALPNGVGP